MVVSDEDFISIWRELGGAKAVSQRLQISERATHTRRRIVEGRTGTVLSAVSGKLYVLPEAPGRIRIDTEDGIHIIGSDAHVWPGERTTAQRGFVKFVKELQPVAVHFNGDIFDGARASRWPRIGWDKSPTVKEELEACQEFSAMVEDAGKNARLFWQLGNHDARFETRLAAQSPEYEGIKGFALKDHFPRWNQCWSAWVNDELVIKHRYHNGIHAVYNNTLKSGKSVVTGHLHSLKVTPFTDYNGTRFGVDGGTLANPYGEQFAGYMEDNPRNWVAGFIVVTFHKGKMLEPEKASVWDDNHMQFRGNIIEV